MISKTIHIEDIGAVVLTKYSNARNLKITIKPFSGIHVSMPKGINYSTAERFVRSKVIWIKKSLDKIYNIEKKRTIFSESTNFRTHKHTLKIEPYESENYKFQSLNGWLIIYYPKHKNIISQEVQEVIKKGIEWALRKEAKEYLPARLRQLAITNGFKFNRVFIKNNKTRWGSCSSINNINLNIHLMRLPGLLTDFVLLHELTHTVHKNHGREFKRKLDSITGNAKGLENELKKFNIELF